MLKRMTTIVFGPNDKISGTAVVSAPPSVTEDAADPSDLEADDRTEEEKA